MEPTDAERRLIAEAARNEQCRRSLAEFARQAWHVLEPATPLKWGWALDAICLHLEAVTNGDIKRLLMNVPPGSMKSLLTGVIWPSWEWGPRDLAETRYIATAHKQDLAVRDNMKARRLIQSPWFQARWPVRLTGDQNAKTKFENERTGFREAMSFTSMTGSRGDRIILDDPHSVDDANSAARLTSDIVTFREALPSRVNNEDSAIVIIMQRLHEADVSAVAIDLGYEHLCIPMRFEHGRNSLTSIGWSDPRTVDGELMFPERFPEEQVADLENTLGPYAVAGQLQQSPAPRAGGMFKPDQIETIGALPAGRIEWLRGWDLAATTNGDYTVGAKVGRMPDGRFVIADIARDRLVPDERDQLIKTIASRDGVGVPISIPQDPGQAGKSLALHHVRMLAGFNVKATTETGDKETRSEPFAAQVNIGNVVMLRGEWNQALLDEMRTFPMGRHDDQIDALSRAFNTLTIEDIASAGFLDLIRKENAERIARQAPAPTPPPVSHITCPYAVGSVEHAEWMASH